MPRLRTICKYGMYGDDISIRSFILLQEHFLDHYISGINRAMEPPPWNKNTNEVKGYVKGDQQCEATPTK